MAVNPAIYFGEIIMSLLIFIVLAAFWYGGLVCGRKWGTVPETFAALKRFLTNSTKP